MTLTNEIAALREEIDKKMRSRSEKETHTGPSTEADHQGQANRNSIDALLAAVAATVEELGQDVDKFPRLSVTAGFGFGLALGFAFGRQVR